MQIRCSRCGAEADFIRTGSSSATVRYLGRDQDKCEKLKEEVAAKGKVNLAEFDCEHMAKEADRAFAMTRRR
jgi:hypothetical protein